MYFIYNFCFFLELKSLLVISTLVIVQDFKTPLMANLIYNESLPVFFLFLFFEKKFYGPFSWMGFNCLNNIEPLSGFYDPNFILILFGFVVDSGIFFGITLELMVILIQKIDGNYMKKSYFCKKLYPF